MASRPDRTTSVRAILLHCAEAGVQKGRKLESDVIEALPRASLQETVEEKILSVDICGVSGGSLSTSFDGSQHAVVQDSPSNLANCFCFLSIHHGVWSCRDHRNAHDACQSIALRWSIGTGKPLASMDGSCICIYVCTFCSLNIAAPAGQGLPKGNISVALEHRISNSRYAVSSAGKDWFNPAARCLYARLADSCCGCARAPHHDRKSNCRIGSGDIPCMAFTGRNGSYSVNYHRGWVDLRQSSSLGRASLQAGIWPLG